MCLDARAHRSVGLGDRADLPRDFGLDASAFVDVDMGNSRVFLDINIRQLATETSSRKAPIGKAPIGKTPVGKAPLGKAPLVTRG